MIGTSGCPFNISGQIARLASFLPYCTCTYFSTLLLSLTESWLVKKVSQRASVHGISQQQERWDRDESRRCPILQLSAGISPRLIPLLVWLQQGHDLQRSQILQVSPVINQSNMSRVHFLWPSPQQFTDRVLIATVELPHPTSIFSKSCGGSKTVCNIWPPGSHHHEGIQTRKKHSCTLYNWHPCFIIGRFPLPTAVKFKFVT